MCAWNLTVYSRPDIAVVSSVINPGAMHGVHVSGEASLWGRFLGYLGHCIAHDPGGPECSGALLSGGSDGWGRGGQMCLCLIVTMARMVCVG